MVVYELLSTVRMHAARKVKDDRATTPSSRVPASPVAAVAPGLFAVSTDYLPSVSYLIDSYLGLAWRIETNTSLHSGP